MIIMIIFLVLGVVLVIGTAIYLNYKKKNINRDIKRSNQVIKEKGNKKTKKQLADLLQIEIKDNIVCLGNRYSIQSIQKYLQEVIDSLEANEK